MLFTKRVFFLLLFCISFFSNAQAQDLYNPKPDSTVYMETEDYEDDTLHTYSVMERGFYKGELVAEAVVKYLGRNKWDDSITSKTYFRGDKKIKTVSHSVSYHERVEDPRKISHFDLYTWPGGTVTANAPTVHIETTSCDSEKLYLDSGNVTHWELHYEKDTTNNYDTLVYCFNNRFFKYHVEWWHGNRVTLRKRDYIFDEMGKLKAHKEYSFSGSHPTERWVEVLLRGKDTLPLVDRRTEWRDTVGIHHVLTSSFDSSYRQTGHLWLINGKESSRSSTTYHPNGRVKEVKQWREGKLEITTRYWWKEGQGKQEIWTWQDNKNYPEYSGNFYGRTDTVFVKGKMVVDTYGSRIKREASACISEPRAALRPSYHAEFDEKGRVVYMANYSGSRKKPSFVQRYRYSK